jgi:hypothetical protein
MEETKKGTQTTRGKGTNEQKESETHMKKSDTSSVSHVLKII